MTAPSRMSAVMEQLVAGARSSRDGVFNTLDAIERKSKSANESLVGQVARICAEHPAHPGAPAPSSVEERDARFDPEDEWDQAAPSAIVSGAAASNTPVRASGSVDDDDEDGYPQTWLR